MELTGCVWFSCSLFSELASLHFLPLICTPIQNFHTHTPATTFPMSQIFWDFLEGSVLRKHWTMRMGSCLVVLSKAVTWLSGSYLSSQYCGSSFPAFFFFFNWWIFGGGGRSFTLCPLFQVRSYILCLYSFESHHRYPSLYSQVIKVICAFLLFHSLAVLKYMTVYE